MVMNTNKYFQIKEFQYTEDLFHFFLDYFEKKLQLGIVIVQSSEIVYINEKLAYMAGYELQELKNFSLIDYFGHIHPEDKQEFEDGIFNCSWNKENEIIQYQFRMKKKSNQYIWVNLFTKIIQIRGKSAIFQTFNSIKKRKTENLVINKFLIDSTLNFSENFIKFLKFIENHFENSF